MAMAGVLNSLVLCILDMRLSYSVLNGHFGPVYLLQTKEAYQRQPTVASLLQTSKNDDEEHCFLK